MLARMRIAGSIITMSILLVTLGCQNPPGPKSSGIIRQQQYKSAPQSDPQQLAASTELDTPGKIQTATYVAAARLHESQGRLLQAIQQYQFALKEEPNNVEFMARIGALYDKIGNGAAAEEVYRQALQIAPEDARLHNNLGFNYIMRRQWRQAEAELNGAVQLAPDFARARINLAMALAQQDRFDEALRQFEIVLPPEDAHYNMGLMYQSKRKLVEAAEHYKRALKRNPGLTAAAQQLKKLPAAVLSEADRRLEADQETIKLAAKAAEKQTPNLALEDNPTVPELPKAHEVAVSTRPAGAQAAAAHVLMRGAEDKASMAQSIRNDYLGAAEAAELDSLLPPWQRTPEVVAELSMDYSWVHSIGGGHWLDLAESPIPRTESHAAKTQTVLAPHASTQPH